MSDKEILNKAIKKAENNRWNSPTFDSKKWFNIESIIFSHDFAKAFWGEKQPQYDKNKICLHCGIDISIQPPFESGCNHTHYGEDCNVCSNKIKDWKFHLQKMVIQEEPLKYLEKFL